MSGLLKVSFPPLCSGELFESWLIWFCHTNHDQTAWLVKELGIGDEVLQGAAPTNQAYSALEKMSEIAKENLLASHLTTFADQRGLAYRRRFSIPGSSLNNSHTPYKVCLECLIADERPYIRLDWALEITGTCPIHQTFLVFDCPHCGRPFRLKLLEPNRAITECRYCNADCRVVREVPRASKEVVRFQLDFLRLSQQERWQLPERGVISGESMVRITELLFWALRDLSTQAAMFQVWKKSSATPLELADDRFSFMARNTNALMLCAWFFRAPVTHHALLVNHVQAANYFDQTGMMPRLLSAFQNAKRSLEQARLA
jgi:TniQ